MNINENIQVLKNAFENGNIFPYYVSDNKTNATSLIITFLSPLFIIDEQKKKCSVEVYDNFLIHENNFFAVSDEEIEEKYTATEKIYDAFNDFKKITDSNMGIIDIMTANKFLCYGKSNSSNVSVVRNTIKQNHINSVCLQYKNVFFSFIHVQNRKETEKIIPVMEKEIIME